MLVYFQFCLSIDFQIGCDVEQVGEFLHDLFLGCLIFTVEIKNLPEIIEGGANCDGWNFIVVQVNCWFDLAEYVVEFHCSE